ncbi:MAG: efflux RND transporter periplasmic adaptor subunit [Alphaproteobacteria bacterium]|nr:MAG: efflux RND transporter periplasmic adaptor subunit [Alphaproteobacteria bacterium]
MYGMKKLIVIALVVLAALVGYHFFNKAMKGGQHGGAGGAMPVSVAVVQKHAVVETQGFSGRFKAVNDAEIRPQVSGTIEKIHFKEGDMVKAGQPLFTLDSRAYKAAVQQAQAGFTEAQGALERGKLLFEEQVIAKREMETRAATYQRAQAALTQARVNLDYAVIKAPINGKIGRADVTMGNVVAPGMAAALTTIQSIDPIYVDFDIDEQTYLKFVGMQRDVSASKPKVEVALATDSNTYPLQGELESTDNRLDPATGSLRARAVLANADGNLIPGLFARVRVGSPDTVERVLVNDAAVGTDQSKRFVYVVGDDNKTAYREVAVGGLIDGLRVVLNGLNGGERVVVNGLMRVMPGAEVTPEVVDMVTLTSGTTPAPKGPAEVSPSAPAAEPVSATEPAQNN